MPSRNVSLTPVLDQVIERALKSGEYENASEVVRAALRLFAAREKSEAAKLKALARALDEGDATGVFEGDATAAVLEEVSVRPSRPGIRRPPTTAEIERARARRARQGEF